MKKLYASVIFSFICLITFSQDTCQYVANNNNIGGLDCAMGSLAPYQADSYQWLNCDSLFAPFPNDTNYYYSGATTSIHVALVVNYLGCIDTSYCQYVCSWGIEELIPNDKKLLRIVNLNGEETLDQHNILLIYIYNDGTRKKVFRIE